MWSKFFCSFFLVSVTSLYCLDEGVDQKDLRKALHMKVESKLCLDRDINRMRFKYEHYLTNSQNTSYEKLKLEWNLTNYAEELLESLDTFFRTHTEDGSEIFCDLKRYLQIEVRKEKEVAIAKLRRFNSRGRSPSMLSVESPEKKRRSADEAELVCKMSDLGWTKFLNNIDIYLEKAVLTIDDLKKIDFTNKPICKEMTNFCKADLYNLIYESLLENLTRYLGQVLIFHRYSLHCYFDGFLKTIADTDVTTAYLGWIEVLNQLKALERQVLASTSPLLIKDYEISLSYLVREDLFKASKSLMEDSKSFRREKKLDEWLKHINNECLLDEGIFVKDVRVFKAQNFIDILDLDKNLKSELSLFLKGDMYFFPELLNRFQKQCVFESDSLRKRVIKTLKKRCEPYSHWSEVLACLVAWLSAPASQKFSLIYNTAAGSTPKLVFRGIGHNSCFFRSYDSWCENLNSTFNPFYTTIVINDIAKDVYYSERLAERGCLCGRKDMYAGLYEYKISFEDKLFMNLRRAAYSIFSAGIDKVKNENATNQLLKHIYRINYKTAFRGGEDLDSFLLKGFELDDLLEISQALNKMYVGASDFDFNYEILNEELKSRSVVAPIESDSLKSSDISLENSSDIKSIGSGGKNKTTSGFFKKSSTNSLKETPSDLLSPSSIRMSENLSNISPAKSTSSKSSYSVKLFSSKVCPFSEYDYELRRQEYNKFLSKMLMTCNQKSEILELRKKEVSSTPCLLKNKEKHNFSKKKSMQDRDLLADKITSFLRMQPNQFLFKNEEEIFFTLGLNLLKSFEVESDGGHTNMYTLYVNPFSDFYWALLYNKPIVYSSLCTPMKELKKYEKFDKLFFFSFDWKTYDCFYDIFLQPG